MSPSAHDLDRKRGVRRTALWLAALAAAVYFGFIAMGVIRGSSAESRATSQTREALHSGSPLAAHCSAPGLV